MRNFYLKYPIVQTLSGQLTWSHYLLKAYILIDLKMGKLQPENVGQINMYLNYYGNEVNDKGDNPPIGIILCADKDEIAAEYTRGIKESSFCIKIYTIYS